MTIALTLMSAMGIVLLAAALTVALVSCAGNGQSGTPVSTETVSWETEKPAPGEITRIRLVEGLTIRDVDMVRPEGIENILGMLDVDTYEPVDPEHERAVAVLDEASVVLEFYTGDELYGMAWVTDPCEVVVIIEGGGVWYTVTSSVDTVLITAEFGKAEDRS